ncbi:MAG: hypothetical protein IJI22_02470 [Bacilli bacterium]|nr:hypothetical protein [Bacilli bacterium]
MEVLREIQSLSDSEVEEYCHKRIQLLEEYYKDCRGQSLGYQADCNPSFLYLRESDYLILETKCLYNGYIPLGTKIIFGFIWNGSDYINAGLYYYLDDTSYITDFVKFIKDQEIDTENELFDCILCFLKLYFAQSEFKKIDFVDREKMFKLISKTKTSYYEPIKEHSNKMFKGQGNALCTENSVLAQNILSFFNIDSYIAIGLVDTDGKGGSEHAFNLITYTDLETGKKINSLIDFSTYINIMDINHNTIAQQPYKIKVKDLDEDFIHKFLSGKSIIEEYKYAFLELDEISLRLQEDSKIKYYIVDDNTDKNKVKALEK